MAGSSNDLCSWLCFGITLGAFAVSLFEKHEYNSYADDNAKLEKDRAVLLQQKNNLFKSLKSTQPVSVKNAQTVIRFQNTNANRSVMKQKENVRV